MPNTRCTAASVDFFVGAVNTHGAVVVDIDLRLRIFANAANGRAAFTD